ncbi:MAG: cytochrome c4 [Burkholderiales bacterium]|nr:cytochrome c4 [Burkholderiales bacterium]
MKCLRASVLLAAILATPALAQEGKPDPAKGRAIATGVCVACHGVDGNSPITANPVLAGQHSEYIVKQLRNYKSGDRQNPIMNGMAASLSEQDMQDVAAYYASQKAHQGTARDAGVARAGQQLYRGGNADNGTAACAGCHSPSGAGIPAQYPRLKGQHADYTIAQLKAFRAGERTNDDSAMMRSIAARMSDAEIAAVAEYVQGLQ